MNKTALYWLHLGFLALAAGLGPFVAVVPNDMHAYLAAAVSASAALAALFAVPTQGQGQ